MAPLRYDLDLLLPDLGDHPGDGCERRLVDLLGSAEGVDDAHVVRDGDGSAVLCLHVSQGERDLTRIRARIQAAGAELSARYGHVLWSVAGVGHATRADALTALLRRHSGVLDASVGVTGSVRIEFDRLVTDEERLWEILAREGLRREAAPKTAAISEPRVHEGEHDHDHGVLGERGELVLALIGAALYLPARLLDWFAELPALTTGLYLAAFAMTGFVVARDTLTSVRARRFEIDLLMLVAAIGAAALGDWSDAALLLVLFSLGHALEGYAMGRAEQAIEGLADLAPETARRRSGTQIVEVALEDLAVGDVIEVRPNERIAADGVIVAGSTTVDQSPVTGESVPVDKTAYPARDRALVDPAAQQALHRVFAGTLNGPGVIDVVVARPAAESTLARVVNLLNEAETQASPTQQLTRSIERVFVPAVLALVTLLIASPLVTGEPFTESLYRALAVLVAASPCALAIATPSAVLASVARAARAGVLVKGGAPLEALAKVSVIAFDKTGTLTIGHPELTDLVTATDTTEQHLLSVAIAVERSSDHPLARAIVTGASERLDGTDTPGASDVTAVIGKGVTAVVLDEPVWIGNGALFETPEHPPIPPDLAGAKTRLEATGRTTMIVRHGSRYLGIIGVMDTLRPEAAATIEHLHRAGIERMVMLSGDNQRVADAIAASVGIDEAQGELLPDEKVAAVAALASGGADTAMVGDGVNDAPALAKASVGIAMGAAGSDVALETADIALMSDRLDRLPFAISLARRSRAKIRQNLVFSLGVVAILIPAALAGVGIGPAVVIHEGSTLVVVANALLLLAFPEVPVALEPPRIKKDPTAPRWARTAESAPERPRGDR